MPWALGFDSRPRTPPSTEVCDLHDYTDLLLSLGPEAWWRLNETSGSVAADSSGNAHHGAYNAGCRLADFPGNCTEEKYVNVPATAGAAAVVVPDLSAVSLPNDFTVVAGVKFLTAFSTGSTLAGMAVAIKANEWYIQSVSQDLSCVENNTSSGTYRETARPTSGGSPLLSGGWHQLIVRYPASGAITFALNGTDPYTTGVSSNGPTGTRRGDTTSVLWLGYPDQTMSGGTDASHGRFLSNIAIYDRILDSTEVADLWNAWDSDGWN